MKEARIILPYDPDNVAPHAQLRQELMNAYGGYTSFNGVGAWRSDKADIIEPIVVYDVAMADLSHDCIVLFGIAKRICAAAQQECVYVRAPDGYVHFVKS
jgi:hypothetical protein